MQRRAKRPPPAATVVDLDFDVAKIVEVIGNVLQRRLLKLLCHGKRIASAIFFIAASLGGDGNVAGSTAPCFKSRRPSSSVVIRTPVVDHVHEPHLPERQPQDAIQVRMHITRNRHIGDFLGPSQRGSIDANRRG